jgi:hypothetical protein
VVVAVVVLVVMVVVVVLQPPVAVAPGTPLTHLQAELLPVFPLAQQQVLSDHLWQLVVLLQHPALRQGLRLIVPVLRPSQAGALK